MDALRMPARVQAGRSVEPTAAAIDRPSVKTTESGGPAGYDAGQKIRGRKRQIAVNVDGSPIVIHVHEASVQDRGGAPAVILGRQAMAPTVTKRWADGGDQGPKLATKRREMELDDRLEIITKPKERKERKGCTVRCRRWVVERTFGWMGR